MPGTAVRIWRRIGTMHRKLIRQTRELLDSCDKDSKKIWFNMMSFLLHELLMSHLLEDDKKCRKYLRE